MRRASSPSGASVPEMSRRASSRVMRAGRAVPAAASIASARALGGPADSGQFFPPAPHQLALGLVALSLAGGAGGHAPGTVGGVAPALALGPDLGRPFRVGLHDLVGDAGDLPVLEPPRRPRVRLDRVTELHGDARCREPSGHGGGVQVLSPQRGVRRLPPALLVLHFHKTRFTSKTWSCGHGSPAREVAWRVWA